MTNPFSTAWILMARAGIDGDTARTALADLVAHVRATDAAALRDALPSLGDIVTLERAADFLEDPAMREEYLPAPQRGSACGCHPHGPSERCTCTGCTGCIGHEMGCTCDVIPDCDHTEL